MPAPFKYDVMDTLDFYIEKGRKAVMEKGIKKGRGESTERGKAPIIR